MRAFQTPAVRPSVRPSRHSPPACRPRLGARNAEQTCEQQDSANGDCGISNRGISSGDILRSRGISTKSAPESAVDIESWRSPGWHNRGRDAAYAKILTGCRKRLQQLSGEHLPTCSTSFPIECDEHFWLHRAERARGATTRECAVRFAVFAGEIPHWTRQFRSGGPLGAIWPAGWRSPRRLKWTRRKAPRSGAQGRRVDARSDLPFGPDQ